MADRQAQVGWRFWGLWVLASTVGWIAGFVAQQPGWFLLGVPANVAWFEVLPVCGPVCGVVGGALLGAVQWLVLRRRVSQAGWWVLASAMGLAVGLAVGGAVGGLAIIVAGWRAGRTVGMAADLAVAGTLLGATQWLVLRQRVSRAGWWVLANASGWVLGACLIYGYVGLTVVQDFWVLCSTVCGAGVLVGAISGAALVWLLRGAIQTGEQAHEQGN